jgi:predicted O-methyltransferase YrrM
VTALALDTVKALQAHVGYGSLGTGGALGYEGKHVSVRGARYEHALSSHPPARLLYHLGGTASRFRCRVALNDDVPAGSSSADFAVIVDGRTAGIAADVLAGEPPRDLDVAVDGGQLLELVVTTSRWTLAHAVWLEPELEGLPPTGVAATTTDCLERADIERPPPLPPAARCIATVASPGFEGMLDDMLGSFAANGNCPDARVVVLLLGDSEACERVVAKHRALPVRCRPRTAVNVGSKALLYSIARVVDAERYVCLDADTLVLGDLAPLFAAVDACPDGSLLAGREGNGDGYRDVAHILSHAYCGKDDDVARILGDDRDEGAYPFVVNDGVFAGSRTALLALDAAIRAMPGARSWLDERPDISWRNQLVFNLALARLRCGVELDASYNLQMHTTDVAVESTADRVRVTWQGRPVRVLHVNGHGRNKLPKLRGLYAQVADPLPAAGDGDLYGSFLAALRAWLGRHGTGALTWSFYGKRDAASARVRDPSMLPVFALVHYLVRAQGCIRVLETGTARGVSAACLASAVAHRDGGRVVTFDPWPGEGRAALWAALPEQMGACIEARAVDSLAGMHAALAAGERYDAALLDSIHTAQHLGAELELAHRLVCPGGLILVHDGAWIDGVAEVLADAQRDGYGVARLLAAGTGVAEEDGLGIAVIENRQLA